MVENKPSHKSRPVPPTVHFVRHAQAYHNLAIANHAIHDPILTPHGKEQCHRLAHDFPFHSNVELLVSSPLRRTLYTTLIGFAEETKRGIQIVALPEAQETGAVPCDTGSDLEVLEEEFNEDVIDFSLVQKGWNSKKGKWTAGTAAVKSRAREVRQWLKARPEKEIVLLTHGGFLHYLTEDWTDFSSMPGTGWRNTEYRSYQFKVEAGDNVSLIETRSSRAKRKGTEIPLTETERLEFERTEKRKLEQVHKCSAKTKDTRDWIGAY